MFKKVIVGIVLFISSSFATLANSDTPWISVDRYLGATVTGVVFCWEEQDMLYIIKGGQQDLVTYANRVLERTSQSNADGLKHCYEFDQSDVIFWWQANITYEGFQLLDETRVSVYMYAVEIPMNTTIPVVGYITHTKPVKEMILRLPPRKLHQYRPRMRPKVDALSDPL